MPKSGDPRQPPDRHSPRHPAVELYVSCPRLSRLAPALDPATLVRFLLVRSHHEQRSFHDAGGGDRMANLCSHQRSDRFGLVGLVQFFPVVLLSLVIGQAADRFDRRAIAAGIGCQGNRRPCSRAWHSKRVAHPRKHARAPAPFRYGKSIRVADDARPHSALVPEVCCHARSRPRQVRNRPPSCADPPWAA